MQYKFNQKKVCTSHQKNHTFFHSLILLNEVTPHFAPCFNSISKFRDEVLNPANQHDNLPTNNVNTCERILKLDYSHKILTEIAWGFLLSLQFSQ